MVVGIKLVQRTQNDYRWNSKRTENNKPRRLVWRDVWEQKTNVVGMVCGQRTINNGVWNVVRTENTKPR